MTLLESEAGSSSTSQSDRFDIVAHYEATLAKDDSMAMPVAAIECLAECMARSRASTMQELIGTLNASIEELKAQSMNSISLTAGCELFLRYLTCQRPPIHISFQTHKHDLVTQTRTFVRGSRSIVTRVSETAATFVEDGVTVLVHGYSRVVTQALLYAAKEQKKRFSVFVTESRPFGLGLRTHAILKDSGIPCCVILDSAVAYSMAKCDIVLLGAEGVVENGGLVNYIGSYQMSLAAKALGKPVYALAESYKFLRLFPLSQFDLPTGVPLLQFPDMSAPITSGSGPSVDTATSTNLKSSSPFGAHPRRPMMSSPMPKPLEPTSEMITNNPLLDYTTPDLIHLIVSDVGVLTPAGVSDALLGVFGGE